MIKSISWAGVSRGLDLARCEKDFRSIIGRLRRVKDSVSADKRVSSKSEIVAVLTVVAEIATSEEPGAEIYFRGWGRSGIIRVSVLDNKLSAQSIVGQISAIGANLDWVSQLTALVEADRAKTTEKVSFFWSVFTERGEVWEVGEVREVREAIVCII